MDSVEAEAWLKYYAYSPAEPPQLKDDNGGPFSPRYLELEGFYVGKKPFSKIANLFRVEQRVYREGGNTWFGEDGRLNNLPNPIKYFPGLLCNTLIE